MKTKTISGKKQFEKLCQMAKNMVCICLSNDFQGQQVADEQAGEILRSNADWKKPTWNAETGRYTLQLHSNCWYEFEGSHC